MEKRKGPEMARMTVDMSAVMREAIREKADLDGQTDVATVRAILSIALREEIHKVAQAVKKEK